MLGEHPIDVVLLATDLESSKRFYAGKLGGSPGYYVVWRGAGVHVSLPDAAGAETTRCLSRQPAGVLRGSA